MKYYHAIQIHLYIQIQLHMKMIVLLHVLKIILAILYLKIVLEWQIIYHKTKIMDVNLIISI